MATSSQRPGGDKETAARVARLVLLGCLAAQLAGVGLPRYAYPLLLPPMRAEFDLSYFAAGALASGNFVGFLVAAFAGGVLAVRIGTRRTVTAALALCAAAMVGSAVAPSYPALLIAQAAVGLGAGAVPPAVASLAALWAGDARRGLALGVVYSSMGLALLTAGLLLPAILVGSGWRSGWFVLAAVAALGAIVVALTLREAPVVTADARRVSWRGVYAARGVWHWSLLGLASGFCSSTYATFFAAWLMAGHGFEAAPVGQLWSLTGLVAIGSGLLWGAVSDRLGQVRALALMFAVQGLACALFVAPAVAIVVVSALLFGATLMGFQVIVSAALAGLVPPRLGPAGQGLSVVTFGVGQALGPAVAGRVGDLAGSLAPAFVVAAAVALLASAATLRAPQPT